MPHDKQTMLNTFGLDRNELQEAIDLANTFIDDPNTACGMDEFTNACRAAGKRKCRAIRETELWLATAGTYALMFLQKEDSAKLDSWETLLKRVLAHPPSFRDWADWWLFFTALAAGTTFQLETCRSRKKEPRLTGHLLEALKYEGKIWSGPISNAIARVNGRLAISEIDLEVGGGEQKNGGDFGLILDFDGRTVQPGEPKRDDDKRIVPLIFQAKRFFRPMANVAQTHHSRGSQHGLLSNNKCASAYIFYDNLGNPTTPLPPLVKPVERILDLSPTNVLEDSLDFATYLLRAATNPVVAPRAKSADNALEMIFSKATPNDLSALIVISGDPQTADSYQSSLKTLKPLLEQRRDEDGFNDWES